MDHYRHDGLTFDVTDAGPSDGELIVLLHGFPETRSSWDKVIPSLTEAGYRVIAPDQRGYSPRARPKGRRSYTLDKTAGDIVALADEAGVDKFHVVGHDWGGGVAWALATLHPDRLHTMASLATPHPRAMIRSLVRSTQGLKSWYFLLFQLPRVPELAFGPFQRWFRAQLEKSGLERDAADRYLSVLAQPGAATAALNWYRAVPFAPAATRSRVTVPTLYVYGDGDFALGRKAADLTAEEVTGPYRFEVLEGASHWLPEEVPDRIAALVLKHVRR